MYTNDVEDVLIEGEDSYKVAKAQMKMLIPSHAKRVTNMKEQSICSRNTVSNRSWTQSIRVRLP